MGSNIWANIQDLFLKGANIWDFYLRGANIWNLYLKGANIWNLYFRVSKYYGFIFERSKYLGFIFRLAADSTPSRNILNHLIVAVCKVYWLYFAGAVSQGHLLTCFWLKTGPSSTSHLIACVICTPYFVHHPSLVPQLTSQVGRGTWLASSTQFSVSTVKNNQNW